MEKYRLPPVSAWYGKIVIAPQGDNIYPYTCQIIRYNLENANMKKRARRNDRRFPPFPWAALYITISLFWLSCWR